MTDPKTKKAMSSAKEQRDKLQPKPRAPKPPPPFKPNLDLIGGYPTDQPSPLRQYAKAITALLTPLVALGATKAGLHLSNGACAGVAAVVTSGLVWLVPNARLLVSSTQQKG